MRSRRQGGSVEAVPSTTPPATEDVLVRNHDFQWGYDLSLTVADLGGEPVFERRYYLQPGGSRSEFDVIGPGEYVVRAVLDNRRTVRRQLAIDAGTAGGLLVELGNGALSLHDGLYA